MVYSLPNMSVPKPSFSQVTWVAVRRLAGADALRRVARLRGFGLVSMVRAATRSRMAFMVSSLVSVSLAAARRTLVMPMSQRWLKSSREAALRKKSPVSSMMRAAARSSASSRFSAAIFLS